MATISMENVLSGARKKSTKPPTAAQLAHRQKIKLVSKFCGWIKPIVNFGYQFEETKNSGRGNFNFLQHIFKNALDVDVENKPVINMEKVQVFVGELVSPEGVQARWEDDLLKLSWIPNPKYGDSMFKLNLAVSLDREGDLKMAIADAARGNVRLTSRHLERINLIIMSTSVFGIPIMVHSQILPIVVSFNRIFPPTCVSLTL
jgi:hypothetical protein